MSASICREIGYKEYCFNVASKFVGCNAKQCCYACAGISEKPLYINNENHSYLYVAISEGHVNCLSKIVKRILQEINKSNLSSSEKENKKISYLQKIYMSIKEINIDNGKKVRMIYLLSRWKFYIDDQNDIYQL